MIHTMVLIVVLGFWAGPAASAASPDVEHLNSGQVLPEGLPFSEAVRAGNTLYLSGQIGVRPSTLDIVEGGMAAQARQTLENIKTTLEAHGYGMGDVVKCTVMLLDMSEWGAFNEIYMSYFSPPYPARSAFGASGLAVGAHLELECIAVVDPTAPGARRASADDPR
jgi:2-iminobutanoate/2-iminopropanoate deaminase